MYKSRELRDAEFRELAGIMGSEDIPRFGVKGYPSGNFKQQMHAERLGTKLRQGAYDGLIADGWISETGDGTKGEPVMVTASAVVEEPGRTWVGKAVPADVVQTVKG